MGMFVSYANAHLKILKLELKYSEMAGKVLTHAGVSLLCVLNVIYRAWGK